jgi:hypothetical protein
MNLRKNEKSAAKRGAADCWHSSAHERNTARSWFIATSRRGQSSGGYEHEDVTVEIKLHTTLRGKQSALPRQITASGYM